MNDFRAVFLPYCLKKQPDGRYLVLNRAYKPVGFFTRDHVEYGDYPIAVKLRGLRAKTAAKLSGLGDPKTDDIFLYTDGSVPTHSKKNMGAYLVRLEPMPSA